MSTASGAVPANDLPDDLVPAGDLPDNVNATAAAPSGPPGPISQGVEALRQSPVGAAAEGTAGGLWNLVVKAGSGYAGALGAALPGPAGQGAAWQQGVENAASYQPQNRVLNSAMQKGEQLAETPSPLTRAVDTYSAAHPAAGAAIGAASQGVIQTAPLALGLAGAPEAAAAEETAAAPRTPPKTTPGPITAAELKAAPERLPPVTKPESTPPAGGATPAGTSPTTAPPAAAPEPAPVRFTAPEATGTQHGALPAAEQASRAQALDQLHEDSGGQLPERRASAITGDYSETGTDYQHAQMPGPAGDRMKGQIAAENGALKVASENTVDATGGVAHGVDQPALAERGATIDRALQGVSDWFDNNVKTLYKAADAQAGGMPIQKFTNTQQLLSDPTQFAGTVEGEALHRGAVARAQSLGLVGENGAWNPATVQQAENFRSWIGDQYTPRTARMLYKMKDAVDNDVATHGGAAVYQASRALRAKQSQMLEGPTGISKLLDADNTGVNRAVPIERVADHVTNLPRDQFNHVVNVLHDSSKLGNGELAEGNAAALNEIRGHMAARLHEAGASARDGSWDPYKYHQTLDKYSLKMPSVFSPEGMQRYKTINDAGNALRMDKRYPGAAAQIAKTGGLRALAAPRIAGAVEGLATGWLGPARGLAVEATGIAPAIRSGIERVVGGDTAAKNLKAINSRILPAGKTPLGAKIGGGSQRGAVGNLGRSPYETAPTQKDVWGGVRAMNDRMPQREQRTGNPYETGGGQTMGARVFGGKQRGAVGDLSQRDQIEHESGPSPIAPGITLHRYTAPAQIGDARDNGALNVHEYPELGVRQVHSSEVRQSARGQGWGTRMLQRAADDAHDRGQVLHSDDNVSQGQAGAYANLARLGYKVTKKDSDLRGGAYQAVGDHVFEVRPRKPSAYEKSGDLRDLCPKMANVQPYNAAQLANKFPGQRGGPKFSPKDEAPLAGAPEGDRPNGTARRAAAAYAKSAGIDRQPLTDYRYVPPDVAKNVADAYEAMKHDPTNPKTAAAYAAFKAETLAQYKQMQKAGVKVSLDKDYPYKAPRDVQNDVRENNHMSVFPTEQGFGETGAVASDHPLLEKSPVQMGGKDASYNDLFRAVHDYYGHVAEGNGFRANGEYNAWRSHRTMYSDAAKPAMDSETLGQNSWVNSGPYAKANEGASQTGTTYAQQKAGLLPPKVVASAENGVGADQHHVTNLLTDQERGQLRTDTTQRLMDAFHGTPATEEYAAAALAGSAKRGWYRNSAQAIANAFGPDAPRFSALLSSMSPQVSVQTNFSNALKTFVNWDKAGRPQDAASIRKIMEDSSQKSAANKGNSNVLDAWVNNGVRSLTSADPTNVQLSGPKVHSFYNNLNGHVNEVTNDAWMAAFAKLDPAKLGGGLNKSGPGKSASYLALSARVRDAAKTLTHLTGETWTPAEVQETVWSWAKTAYEHAEELGDRSIPELVKNGDITDDLIKSTPDFHQLFSAPEHRGFLQSSRYAGNAERVAAGEKQSAVTAHTSQARAAAAKTLRPALLSAAERLEKLRQERNAAMPGEEAPF